MSARKFDNRSDLDMHSPVRVRDDLRLAALGRAAALLVEDGMTIGLGSGSTAEAVVRALGERVADGLHLTGVPTSARTADLARSLNIPLNSLESQASLDLGLDGADEIDPHLDVVKGRGGALLHEKLVALSCDRWIVIAASEKLVDQLGKRIGVPVEIVPVGWKQTSERLANLEMSPRLRLDRSGRPVVTDGGHHIVDCETGLIADPQQLSREIKSVTGVVDHGLFIQMADSAMLIEPDGSVRSIER